jgi:hypothetical protein
VVAKIGTVIVVIGVARGADEQERVDELVEQGAQ